MLPTLLLCLSLSLALRPTRASGTPPASEGGGGGDGAGKPKPQLVMVQTLTRHGSRAPDKILAEETCRPLFEEGKNLHALFVGEFGTGPAELTDVGSTQMRDVGRFLMERYGKKGFVKADYPPHTTEWVFNAREGARQQRSMMGIIQGMFPDEAVPILVRPRAKDAVLGGPAPQCADKTREYILNWHATEGRKLVEDQYEAVVKPFEVLCDVSLRDNPANPTPNGGNPHAYIGDISDLMDSLSRNQRGDLPISKALHEGLTRLAFELEQRGHFDDPRGATMFAGEFPRHLLNNFEQKLTTGRGPRMYLHTCSREVFYGLEKMFGWYNSFQLSPANPPGRIRSGTTFIFELYDDGTLKALVWTPSVWGNEAARLQADMPLADFKAKYEAYVKEHGTWQELCGGETPSTAALAQLGGEDSDAFSAAQVEYLQRQQPVEHSGGGSKGGKAASKDSADAFFTQTLQLGALVLFVGASLWLCTTTWRRRAGAGYAAL